VLYYANHKASKQIEFFGGGRFIPGLDGSFISPAKEENSSRGAELKQIHKFIRFIGCYDAKDF
jgi:hypothetical protein